MGVGAISQQKAWASVLRGLEQALVFTENPL
jgi:hypothetical protein